MFKRSFPFVAAATLVLLVNTVFAYTASASNIPGTSIPTTVTRLMLENSTSNPIYVGVTVQAISSATQDGCGVTIANLELLNPSGTVFPLTVNPSNTMQGTCLIPANTTYELVSTLVNPSPVGGAPASQNCLQGLTATFGAWQQCPNGGATFPGGGPVPNGVNQFEPTLNLPGTVMGGMSVGGNETVDITCVNGANSILQATINAPVATNLWTYDSTKTIASGGSLTSANSWVKAGTGGCDDNCSVTVGGVTTDRPFVYPFGCTLCNEFPNPVFTCGQFCAAKNGLPPNTGCTIDRSPATANIQTQQFGGTILVSYMGPAMPPATCPGTAPNHHGFPPKGAFVKPTSPPLSLNQLRDFYLYKQFEYEYLKRHDFFSTGHFYFTDYHSLAGTPFGL